ncbi:hypothetical protein BDV24DRAFT_161456 [Aspergillus arachidicola]|uniref:Uncharacterized protein n=1 Tax=Aspergillus arachidicola TaxID=656916 RepID=A0A5N6YG33_9EURO|nr:hypothetical protein BDV24DRAFT_161456 [Aspergillus arachidicola]
MDELETAESTFSGAVGSANLCAMCSPLRLKIHPQVGGKKALQEDYEFNADLGSLLNDYAVSVFGVRLAKPQKHDNSDSTSGTL